MKDKILTALKAAIGKNSSINDKTLNAYVAIIEDKITDESQIGEAIKPYAEVLKEFQGNINSVAAAAASAKETELKAAQSATPAAPKAEDGKAAGVDDLDAKFQAMVDAKVKPMQDELAVYKAKETASARQNLILNKAKELGIPEWRVKQGFIIPDDADETAIGEALSAVKQDIVTAGLGTDGRFPLVSNDKISKEEADKIVGSMNV